MNIHPTDTFEDEKADLGSHLNELGLVLRLAQLRAFREFFAQSGEAGMKPGEYTVLYVIGLNPDLRQGTIARTLDIKPAHMTKLVQRLVKDGKVRRRVPAGDRRSVRLSLTEAGKAYVNDNHEVFSDPTLAQRCGLTPDEGAQLLSLLQKFVFSEARR